MIKLKDITKYYYGDSSVTLALKDINLEFKKGEFVAITGKSGSGKSTLINLISGMDTYEEGEMYFKGMETSYFDVSDWELYRKNNISFVYQSYNLIDSYTALQNIETVMMICENDENRLSKKERRKKAMQVLKKVGLEKQAHNKATHMSSGQKQRLGIARALAKDTDVIMADEPTGNLDVENGKAIMALLHELSKEGKLVIVVTHNYEQAEPFVTRKIRLFDGEIVEDTKIDEQMYANTDFQDDYIKEIHEEKEAKKTFKIARRFVRMNRFAQPHRTLFILMFLIISITASTIFMGNFISNLDDTYTKEISTTAFKNTDEQRILIKNLNGEPLTEEDFEEISKIKHVTYVEKSDNASDCNYFITEDEDYKEEYEVGTAVKRKKIKKIGYTKFLKSAGAISESDLAEGRLPEGIREIVLYTDDKSLLGTKINVYVQNRDWREAYYLGDEFEIVGILKEESEQVYFNDGFIEGFDKNVFFSNMTYTYTIQDKKVYEDIEIGTVVSTTEKSISSNIVIGEGLTGNQARISDSVILGLEREGKQLAESILYRDLLEKGSITRVYDDGTEETFEIVYVQEGGQSSDGILEVSEELYYKILGENDMTQTSVFIDDYAYMDEVLNELYEKEYDAISVYRVSATEYVSDKVSQRLMTLAMSVAIVTVIFVLDILVIYMLMKLKKGDFIIMKSLGMKQKMANQMNIYELVTLVLFACILVIVAANALMESKIPYITDIIKYYRVNHYVILITINVLMAVITSVVFNRYLSKRLRLTSVKND